MLKNLPLDHRPRERLQKLGSEALSIIELIAILLQTGTIGKSAISLAEELVANFKDIDALLSATVEELQTFKGIGFAKAMQLKAAFALASKLKSSSPKNRTIEKGSDIHDLLKEELFYEKQEVLIVVLKDVRKRLIHYEKVSIGTLSEVLAHPREIFYPAVRHKASTLVLVHNHPSGDPTPSHADLVLTQALLKASKIMGIAIDDHVILAGALYYSMKEAGTFK